MKFECFVCGERPIDYMGRYFVSPPDANLVIAYHFNPFFVCEEHKDKRLTYESAVELANRNK